MAALAEDTMSKSGTLDLASGLGGKIDKEEVKSAVDEYVYLNLGTFLCVWRDLCYVGYCEGPDDVWE